MHSSFAWGFWWLNIFICSWCILYWAPKRFPNGTHALIMPSGQMWIWQLVFSLIVLKMDASPWNLIWLAAVSLVVSLTLAKLHRHLRIMAFAREYSATTASAQISSLPSPKATAQESTEVECIRQKYPELIGVRGWLLLFCVMTSPHWRCFQLCPILQSIRSLVWV